MESYYTTSLVGARLPNGAKRYISGCRVSQDVLKKLVEPDANFSAFELEQTIEPTRKGEILSSLTRLKDYGVIYGKKSNEKSRTKWFLNTEYVNTVRSIIYGEK